MKGNDGKGARRRKIQQLSLISIMMLCIIFVIMLTISVISPASSKPKNSVSRYLQDNKLQKRLQPVTNKIRHAAQHAFFLGNVQEGDNIISRMMRKKGVVDPQQQFHRQQLDNDPENMRLLERILDGDLHLVDLHVVPAELAASRKSNGGGAYAGIYGEFCTLPWHLQKENPSQVPMFKQLVSNSVDCELDQRTQHRFDLRHLVPLLRAHDWQLQDLEDMPADNSSIIDIDASDATISDTSPKVLELTAVAFHESRCGSTLVANTFSAMDPEKHRVYSESTPPAKLARICQMEYCTPEQETQLWKDTIYVMSRTNDPKEERVFFKFQSALTLSALSTFRTVFPTVPWLFIYRDPVQVVMSHAKNGALEAGSHSSGQAVCLRTRTRPSQNVFDLLDRMGYADGPSSLTLAEFCAVHLATLTERALEQVEQDEDGNANEESIVSFPINYDKLLDTMMDTVLPYIFQRSELTETERDRILEVGKFYSKGGKDKGKQEETFANDNELKEQQATTEIREAAGSFLDPSYQQLNAFSASFLETAKASIA